MSISVHLFRMLEAVEPDLRGVLLAILEEMEKQQRERVTKDEFNELKEIVAELAEAQKRTEQRLDSLTLRVEELAEAQKRTEARVEELAEAQKRTEARVEELAEAQKRTEEKLEKLIGEHQKTREHLGGLAHTVGYRLEDEAIWALPGLLRRDFNIEIPEGLRRDYLEVGANKYIEVNIYGRGKRDGDIVTILGEAKSQLKKRDVTNFVKVIDRVREAGGIDVFPVLVTYQTPPVVRKAAEEKGIKIYFSYELRPLGH